MNDDEAISQALQLVRESQRVATQMAAELDQVQALYRDLKKQAATAADRADNRLIKAALTRMALEGFCSRVAGLPRRDLYAFCQQITELGTPRTSPYSWLCKRVGPARIPPTTAYRFIDRFTRAFDAERRGLPIGL